MHIEVSPASLESGDKHCLRTWACCTVVQYADMSGPGMHQFSNLWQAGQGQHSAHSRGKVQHESHTTMQMQSLCKKYP